MEDCTNKNKTVVAVVDDYLNTMEDAFIFSPGKSAHTCQKCKTLPGIVRDTEETDNGDRQSIVLCPICFVKYRSNIIDELIERVQDRLCSDKKLNYPYIKNKKSIIYPSIQKIAASHIFGDEKFAEKLGDNDADEISDDEINKILKELGKKPLKPFHKYFAVVQADGDDIRKLAKEMLNSFQKPDSLSKALFEFADHAETIITEYGGVPIFLGGDDILAFMPVYYKGCTVIDFIKALDNKYRMLVNYGNGKTKTALSFGVNMAYGKFPLSTATRRAASLLFEETKKRSNNKKNKAAICLTMHSGTEAKTVLSISGKKFEIFTNLLRGVMQKEEKIELTLQLMCACLYDVQTGIKKSGINSLKEVDSALKLLKIIRFLTSMEENR
ncbi:MAG: hypothetical protein K8R28_11485 [Desulfobacterales bacterium]|nr:hypothetical protein [Desulfobacterales bacterium]